MIRPWFFFSPLIIWYKSFEFEYHNIIITNIKKKKKKFWKLKCVYAYMMFESMLSAPGHKLLGYLWVVLHPSKFLFCSSQILKDKSSYPKISE